MKKEMVKKCCASCHYKMIEKNGSRVCRLTQILVKQQFGCSKWDMAEGLKNMGRSQSMIKRREYLMFVLEIRMQERKAMDDGAMLPEDAATFDTLRKRFEAETGLSPFVIH